MMPDAARIPIAINTELDVPVLAKRFATSGRIQIADFLAPDSAEALRRELAASTGWRRVIRGGSRVFEIPAADYRALPIAERQRIDEAVEKEAAYGFQFRYEVIRVPDGADARIQSATYRGDFARLMSSGATLDLLHAITGIAPLAFADAQATLYRPGDFLTRHDDDVAGKHRKLAYVFGLTSDWRPEWGGLLIFNDHAHGVADTFVPRFNALSLFAVPQPHSVGFVAPFAPLDRVSITGWIRSQSPDP